MAFQVAFDVYESATQRFVAAVRRSLTPLLDAADEARFLCCVSLSKYSPATSRRGSERSA